MMYIFSMSLLIFSPHGFLIKTLESCCPRRGNHMNAFEQIMTSLNEAVNYEKVKGNTKNRFKTTKPSRLHIMHYL